MSNQWYDIDTWQWTDDNTRQWGFIIEPPSTEDETFGLRQIWTDENYIYAATVSGLDIISIETEERQSFAYDSSGFVSVWSSEDYVFMASPDKGVRRLNKDFIGPEDVSSDLHDYARYPDITSDDVRYIHGNDNKMICCTARGIDIVRLNTGYITHTTITGAYKCFVTPNYDYFYYTVSGTTSSGAWNMYRLDGNTGDWTTADRVYTTNSGFLEMATCLTDFYVTEHTSTSGLDNTLFVATDVGVYIYDEGTTDYKLYTVVS